MDPSQWLSNPRAGLLPDNRISTEVHHPSQFSLQRTSKGLTTCNTPIGSDKNGISRAALWKRAVTAPSVRYQPGVHGMEPVLGLHASTKSHTISFSVHLAPQALPRVRTVIGS